MLPTSCSTCAPFQTYSSKAPSMAVPLHSSQALPVLTMHVAHPVHSRRGCPGSGHSNACSAQPGLGSGHVGEGGMKEQRSRWFFPLQTQHPSSLGATQCPSLQWTTENSASTKPSKTSCAKSRDTINANTLKMNVFYKLSHPSVLSTVCR